MSRSPDDPKVNRQPPVTRQFSVRSLVRTLEGKRYRSAYAAYQFSGRTFYQHDERNIVS